MSGQLSIMDPTGHSILRWDPGDAESISDAEKMFKDLLKRQYQAFEFSPIAQGRGKKITKFNANLNEIVMVPPVAGG
jgi:hypothetical protein